MSEPESRRAVVNRRLATGFLASLPTTLREMFALLAEETQPREALLFEVERIGSTARVLGLEVLVDAATSARERLDHALHSHALHPIVRASRELSGVSPFSPIALVGDPRVVNNVEAQDDGCCEPILGFGSVSELESSIGVDWPQAILLPADQAHAVEALRDRFDADVYLYGPSRDAAGRLAAVNVGAAGFVAEPLTLTELLSHVRYIGNDRTQDRLVALVGEPEWARPVSAALREEGVRVHRSTDPLEVAAVMHSLYPEAVVLGPGDHQGQARAISMMRTHIGRSHVALVAVGDPSLHALGADDVLSEDENVASRVFERLKRFRDFRRDRDDLTHIPNRAGALESLQRFTSWSERVNQSFAVALVLADGLAHASHEHGREAGNACRRHLAAALDRGLRRVDLVGSLGGDLFLAGLVNCEAAEAERRMGQIRETFESRVHADRRLREITLAIGVADTLSGTHGLMRRASDALDYVRSTVRD